MSMPKQRYIGSFKESNTFELAQPTFYSVSVPVTHKKFYFVYCNKQLILVIISFKSKIIVITHNRIKIYIGKLSLYTFAICRHIAEMKRIIGFEFVYCFKHIHYTVMCVAYNKYFHCVSPY